MLKTTQCDSCAFKFIEDQSSKSTARHIENKYQSLRNTKGAPKKTRNIHIGGNDDKTETCFIDSPIWLKRNENIYCSDRLDNALSLETALDLREARLANARARKADCKALIAIIIAIIAIIISYFKNSP